jgi:tetratricopeptide (TPR) repeat protein
MFRIRVLFSEACVVFEYLRDHRRLIASLIQLGNTHTACRNLDGALTSLYDAVALARAWEAHCADIKPRISMQRSRSLHNGSFWEPLPSDVAWEIVGDNLSSFSDSDSESEEWHARAAEIRAESLASALQAIGNTLLASGEHEAALDSLRESVGLWQRLANGRRDRTDRQRDKVSRRRRHSRLSDAASLDLSDLNESFGRAMVRSKSVDDSEVAAVNISMSSAPPAALLSPFEPDRSASHRSALTASLLSMAVCQTRLGQFTKAVVALSKCRRARIDCDDWLGVAEVSDHFGYLYHSIGDFSTAIEQLQESRRIYIRLNAFHASYFASGSLLHGTLFAMRDIDKTIDLLGVLLDRHDRAGNAFAIAVVNRALGRALLSGGDTTAALTHLQLAATQFDALRSLSEFVAPTELEHEIRAVRAAITEAEQHQK